MASFGRVVVGQLWPFEAMKPRTPGSAERLEQRLEALRRAFALVNELAEVVKLYKAEKQKKALAKHASVTATRQCNLVT